MLTLQHAADGDSTATADSRRVENRSRQSEWTFKTKQRLAGAKGTRGERGQARSYQKALGNDGDSKRQEGNDGDDKTQRRVTKAYTACTQSRCYRTQILFECFDFQ
eukprot:753776-Hanusia_phi.AAC.5